MQKPTMILGILAFTTLMGSVVFAQDRSDDETAVSRVLDALHEAASRSEFDRYFSLFDGNAIFLGTDATERWTRDEFMDYARRPFAEGRGWTYHMTERHVYLADDGQTAWFDEMLTNENLGVTRGSGALVKTGSQWKIAQYNLTIPVPNQLSRKFVAEIRALTDG